MAKYQYKAVDPKGRFQSGKLDAANEIELEARLVQMNLEIIRCKEVPERSTGLSRQKISRSDIINFCFHMELLTRAGVSIVDGLEDLRDSVEHPKLREVVISVIHDIESGRSLSEALAEQPATFDEVFVNLIAAGEMSGQLPEVFRSLLDMIKWQDELIATTKKLLIMPAFVGFAVLFVIGFLMMYLVPQLVNFIESIGSTLPLHTQLLIATSNFFLGYWYLFTVLPVFLFILVKILARTSKSVRYQLDKLKLKVWQIGPVLKKIILSRFSNFFAMMYKAGVPVLQCIEITERTTTNAAIRSALENARQGIEEGKGVSASFQNTGLFPPLVIRMIKVGETTGDLDEALLNVSYFYDRDIKDSIDKIQAMVQPMMTMVLGGILGWVMISVMGPVYDSISTMQF